MVKQRYSWWGIKNNADDITTQMLDIINSASEFIIVGGYNFTFRSSAGARPFFDALINKVHAGVQVLMMFPPKLHGGYNPQPAIINHCFNNGIAIILNHQNHSKWLLTDIQMYYGSSNFTNASWRDRVEVVSLHDHVYLSRSWAQNTLKDFTDFLNTEIRLLNEPRRRMANYRGLSTATRNAWAGLKPLLLKLNPSIEKVVLTLSNYDKIQDILKEQVVYWFDSYERSYFQMIVNLSTSIMNAVDDLCEFAYGNIYNETITRSNADLNSEIINEYNRLYENAIKIIDLSLQQLPILEQENFNQSETSSINLNRINKIQVLMKQYLGGRDGTEEGFDIKL